MMLPAINGSQTHPIKTEGASTRVDAPPSVVLLHGFLDEASLWGPVIDILAADGYHAVAFDLPGLGSQADDDGPHTLARLAYTVLALIDELDAPIVLVGHSMGTQLAELVGAARPNAVSGIALFAPIPLGGIALPAEVATTMRNLGGNRQGQTELRTQFAVALPDIALNHLLDVGMKVRPEVAAELFDAWSSGDPAGDAPSAFKGPVLIAGGQGDAFATPDLLKGMIAPRFPQATIRFVPNAGHWPHVEQPKATAAVLLAFLNAVAFPD